MKDYQLNQIINEISNFKQLSSQTHPAMTLHSVSQFSNCKNCNILVSVIQQMQTKSTQMCQQYNQLLKQTHRLIDLSCQFFEEQRKHYEQEFQQMQKNKIQLQQKIKQQDQQILESAKTMKQLNYLLFEKHEQVLELQDKFQKETQELVKNSNVKQIEQLKIHRRQKSRVCNKLEMNNELLIRENSQLKIQIQKLNEHIVQMRDYINRMEDDLANVNIKSPRIINQFNDIHQLSNRKFNKTFEAFDKCSIEQESPIKQQNGQNNSEQFLTENLQHNSQQSFRSSFANKRQVLREVLNISGQTSNYFQFRTRQKFLGLGSAQVIKNQSNLQINTNSTSHKQSQNKQSVANILNIKQFQVNETKNLKNNTQCNNQPKGTQNNKMFQKKKNFQSVKTMQQNSIDPYHAFFVLTIQCVKLNWRDMNQVANLRLDDEWEKVLSQQIPINKWYPYLQNSLNQKLMLSK